MCFGTSIASSEFTICTLEVQLNRTSIDLPKMFSKVYTCWYFLGGTHRLNCQSYPSWQEDWCTLPSKWCQFSWHRIWNTRPKCFEFNKLQCVYPSALEMQNDFACQSWKGGGIGCPDVWGLWSILVPICANIKWSHPVVLNVLVLSAVLLARDAKMQDFVVWYKSHR